MAVTLPSDIVADVMRNADPARRRTAEARLQSAGAEFAGMVEKSMPASHTGAADATSGQLTPLAAAKAEPHDDGKASAAQGFERMVLRNLFETLLPDEQSGAFGGGPSAGIWRSMAADQLAGVYTEAGGVGIAGMLQPDARQPAPMPDLQWPYFTLQSIRHFAS